MNDNIKLTLASDDDFVIFRTYDRIHGASHRFIITKEKLHRIFEPDEDVIDEDCDGFISIMHSMAKPNNLTITLNWLCVRTDNSISGYRQVIRVPTSIVHEVCTSKESIIRKCLCHPVTYHKAKIVSTHASATIRCILTDKHIKRAFIKAMRDCFEWSGEIVHLYSDGLHDFFFNTESEVWNINGGLILHTYKRNNKPRLVYAVHT